MHFMARLYFTATFCFLPWVVGAPISTEHEKSIELIATHMHSQVNLFISALQQVKVW